TSILLTLSNFLSQVVLASVPGGNTQVAIKIIPRGEKNGSLIAREQQILRTVRECPFISHLYSAFYSQEEAYFIMEYLSGGSLDALMKRSESMSRESVSFYTAELVCGLQFLHGHNIVHRDLKPQNIMLDASGHIRIIDLGIARDGVTASKVLHGVTGTLRYMAPEVLLRRGYGRAVDWWSLGILVCRIGAGCHPFYSGPIRKMIQDAITTEEPTIPASTHDDVKDLVRNLLRKNPAERLGVCGNIRQHLLFSRIDWEELEQRKASPPSPSTETVLEKEAQQLPKDSRVVH
ncbi:positive regulation of sphingomyelin catabolic process, partial [Pristimantis euphronides]